MAERLRRIGWGPTQSPALNFVLSNESQLFVQGFALRCSVQLDRGYFLIIEVSDRAFQKVRAYSSSAVLRIYENHADPRKSTLERDRGYRTAHLSVKLRDEATPRTDPEETLPVRPSLIPARDLVQPDARGYVQHGHRAEMHGGQGLERIVNWVIATLLTSFATLLNTAREPKVQHRNPMGAMSHEMTSIRDVTELEALLSEPMESTVRCLGELKGDILILGVGGKMGPTLARMAKRASAAAGIKRRVIGVSRFSSATLERRLQSWDVETIRCELLDRVSLSALPDVANIVYMAGMKFGSTDQEALTWAMNSYLPGLVSEKYRKSRIAVFSTGNVYGLSPVSQGGSREEDVLNPVGEYAMSCLGRERIFEHFSRTGQIPMSILRLNYATELRYGVLVDIARRVHADAAVPLSMGYLNAIWQADANAMSLTAMGCASVPPRVINITGPELLSVRCVAEEFGKRLGKSVLFEGVEANDAMLSSAERAYELLGRPRVSASQMMIWVADWVCRGGASLAKPTHFEERSGRF